MLCCVFDSEWGVSVRLDDGLEVDPERAAAGLQQKHNIRPAVGLFENQVGSVISWPYWTASS